MTATILPSLRQARQIHCSGGFDLECAADTALPFFSPEGEREWTSGWDPKPVFPEKIAFDCDTVFREGAPEAIWTIVDVDSKSHRAEYVRFAASHSAHIVVKIESIGSIRSHVTVSYTVTAFGEDPDTLLATYSEPAYAAKMQDWKRRISAILDARKSRR
jgi:hypothetical protein